MDEGFMAAVREAAAQGARDAVPSAAETRSPDALPHRELMRRAKVLISAALAGPEAVSGADAAAMIGHANEYVRRLDTLQGPSGLFEGGDNVQSPPDSAFTVNDACDAHHLLRDGASAWRHEIASASASASAAAIAALRRSLGVIIQRAAPALLTGGVHTPNHRWELAAALVRIHRSFPDPQLVARAEEWLAEGIDIDADGFFSERSPNYATAVSIPSLLTLADILGRSELRRDVERNLHATLSLIASDDSVETLPSRRQDQGTRFPLDRYLAAYRELAVTTGRGDFAWAAERAARAGVVDPGLLAEVLLRPAIGEPLPAPHPLVRSSPAAPIVHESVSLAVTRSAAAEVVVYGGSDYALHRRIRSGLAVDPTFLRLFAGDAVLDSVRLSRTFFGLGPFRAGGLAVRADGALELRERVAGSYYGPLDAAHRDPHGVYDLADDGRFSAAMSFATRPVDGVELVTRVVVHPRDDGADLDLELSGPPVAWSLELTFRPGGTLDAPDPGRPDGAHVPAGRAATYRAGADAIVVEVDGVEPSADPVPYFPGEDYAYLNGTDAAAGVRLLLGGTTPASFTVRLRALRAEAGA